MTSALGAAACLGDVEVPPSPPTVQPVSSPTVLPSQRLRGSKPKGTAIFAGDVVLVPHSDEDVWSANVSLRPGDNHFEILSERPSGLRSRRHTTVHIVYDPPCPAQPTLDATPPSPTRETTHSLSGSKGRGTSIVLNDIEIVAADQAETWGPVDLELPVTEGSNDYVLTAHDHKGRVSDPVRFTVVYDLTPPAIASRYPTAATDSVVVNTNVPTNTSVFVTFAEAPRFSTGEPPGDMLTVSDGGGVVPGVAEFNFAATTLRWTPDVPLSPSTTYTISLDTTSVSDLAGNAALPVPSWTFDTAGGPTTLDPPAPGVTAPASSTTARLDLEGTRPAWTAVLVDGVVRAAPSAATIFSLPVTLAEGDNTFEVALQDVGGRDSPTVQVSIAYALQRPAAPVLDASTPSSVGDSLLPLVGSKPGGTAVLLDGVPVVCLNADTSWGYEAALVPGFNDMRLESRDADGHLSEPVFFSVTFQQQYAGKVPPGWQLRVFYSLRDLTQSDIGGEFITGANNYGVEAWIEGPLSPDETCQFDENTGERTGIEYVATLQHYVGTKAQHTVPFADEDYRGTDYLASLISGGVFNFLGLGPGTDRRDADGRETPGMLIGVTSQDLRSRIDCFGLVGVDACTQATVVAGAQQLPPWEPRRPPNAESLDQGDYLLWVQINLDRDGAWLIGNDYETCWGDPAHSNRGMHRIVRRVSLGSVAYGDDISPAEELSGPDRDGPAALKYLGDDGLRLYWGPP